MFGGRRLKGGLALLVGGLIGAIWNFAAWAAVAMVTDLQGKASIAADGKARDATILAGIDNGAQIQLSSGATLVVLYLDAGDEYVLKGPAQIVFRATQPEVIKGSAPEKHPSPLGPGRQIRIKPEGLTQTAFVVRSSGFRLLGLRDTGTLDTSPEFRWQALQPGLKYQFEIKDDTGRALYEAQTEGTTLRLPASVQLTEGAVYTWEVSTRLPDGRRYSSAGDFKVASASVRAQATALRPAATAPFTSRVAYAVWLDQAGLRDEARKYWQALSVERPEDAKLKQLAAQ